MYFLVCTIPICETVLLPDGIPHHAIAGLLVNLAGFTGRCLEGIAAELCRFLQPSAKAVTDGSAGVLSSVHSFELNIPHSLTFFHKILGKVM